MEALKKICVDEYTTPGPYTVEEETPLAAVKEIMIQNEVRHVPVVRNGQAVGIISQRDVNLLANLGNFHETPAGQVMVGNPYTVTPEETLDKVVFTMSAQKIGSAIVADENHNIIGIFTLTDALNALIEVLRGDVPDS